MSPHISPYLPISPCPGAALRGGVLTAPTPTPTKVPPYGVVGSVLDQLAAVLRAVVLGDGSIGRR